MGEENVAVELTETEIHMVKALAVLAHLLYKIQHGHQLVGSFNAPYVYKNIELKMLKALDALKAKEAETAK